eukprot:9383477-Pyramimonas_sp.AAC.1
MGNDNPSPHHNHHDGQQQFEGTQSLHDSCSGAEKDSRYIPRPPRAIGRSRGIFSLLLMRLAERCVFLPRRRTAGLFPNGICLLPVPNFSYPGFK